jgi:hypothetical protein
MARLRKAPYITRTRKAFGFQGDPPGGALALRSVVRILKDSLAALSKAFFRPHLSYPLESLDISGQRPVSGADASPNEAL